MTSSIALTTLLFAAALMVGCAGSGDLSKVEAGLRTQLDQMDDQAEVECLIGLTTPSPADARDQLEAIGLSVRTVAGDVVTATGTADAVREAAGFAWVLTIEPSRVRPALGSR